MDYEGNDLVTNQPEALYCSHAMDAGEAGTIWHRLVLDAESPVNAAIELYVVTAERPDGADVDQALAAEGIDGFLCAQNADIPQILRFFRTYGKRMADNPQDVPLFSLQGRYLWFCIYFRSSLPVRVHWLRLEFPRRSFADYLPQIYRCGPADGFLPRFLLIFQQMYLEIEERIDQTPAIFDPMVAPEEYLGWLTDWFSLKAASHWEEDKLRPLLRQAVQLFQIKGTRESVRRIVAHCTGETPLVVEQFEVVCRESAPDKQELIKRLFGDSIYTYSVLLHHSSVPDSDTYAEVLHLLRDFQPIDAVCNLVVLQNTLQLDCHCYLGVNSCLPVRTGVALDGQNAPLMYLAQPPDRQDDKGAWQ